MRIQNGSFSVFADEINGGHFSVRKNSPTANNEERDSKEERETIMERVQMQIKRCRTVKHDLNGINMFSSNQI